MIGPDRTASRANRRRMRREIAEQCPTPHQRAHLTDELALRQSAQVGGRVFWCCCGCYHVAKSSLEQYLEAQERQQDMPGLFDLGGAA